MYYVYTPDYASFTLVDKESGAQGPTITDARVFAGILNGDTVRVYDDRDPMIELVERGRHSILAGILELSSKTIYGMTSRNVPIYLFKPFDRRYPPFRVGCRDSSRTNKVATVSFEEWALRDTFPRGALIELLGQAGDFEAEAAGLAVTASPFYSHKAFMGHPCYMEPPAGREMLSAETGWTVFNIDPAGCRDIDDCIAVRGSEFAICIADVDAAVPSGTRVDEYAALTCQTIYRNGVAIRPMLPTVLSEGICSLVAGAARPVVALRGDLLDGTIRNIRFQAANIINGASYTYEAASTLRDVLSPLLESLDCSSEDSHEWISAAMTRYNLEAAKVLMAAGRGILRAHDGVKVEKLAALTALEPSVAARLASEAAAYCLVASGRTHVGFGDAAYCHATSPIRRYADLVNQRILKGLAGAPAPKPHLIYTLNVRGKAAKAYERACAFMDALRSPTKEIDIVPLGDGRRAYVPAWNRLIKCPHNCARVRYYYDATKARWSERLVFEPI